MSNVLYKNIIFMIYVRSSIVVKKSFDDSRTVVMETNFREEIIW